MTEARNSERVRFEDTMLLGLRMEDEAISRGMLAASGKGKEMDSSPYSLQEERSPADPYGLLISRTIR